MGILLCKRGEAVEKRRGGGGVLFESRPWYRKQKLGGVFSSQVDLQITSRVRLVVLYYINFTTGVDLIRFLIILQISPYRYSKGK